MIPGACLSVPAGELAVPLAVRLGEKLGMPHNTPDAVDNARDKVGTGAADMHETFLSLRLSSAEALVCVAPPCHVSQQKSSHVPRPLKSIGRTQE